MTNALAWFRKSKGSDDDIGLVEQRETVSRLARKLVPSWENVHELDLGIQTGFSTLTREDDASSLLDEREDVQATIDDIRSGAYEYIVAWDDTRVARDGYYEVIRHAIKQGGAELVFVADIEEDDLTHDLKRRIERSTKEDEIEKSKRALEARKERGFDHGRPKFGMTYDENGHYQVPGEEFGKVREILERREAGETFAGIAESVGVPESTVRNVVDRRDWYRERAEIEEAA